MTAKGLMTIREAKQLIRAAVPDARCRRNGKWFEVGAGKFGEEIGPKAATVHEAWLRAGEQQLQVVAREIERNESEGNEDGQQDDSR